VLVALHALGREGENIAVGKRDLSLLERPDPVFRSFRIQHDGDRQSELFPDLFDDIDFFLMILMRAVRKIQPHHIHAGKAKLGEHLLRGGGGPDRAYNFGFSHISSVPPQFPAT